MEWSPQQSAHVYHWQLDDWFDFDQPDPAGHGRADQHPGLTRLRPGRRRAQRRALSPAELPADANAAPIDAWLPAWRELCARCVAYQARISIGKCRTSDVAVLWRKVDLTAARPSAADYVKVLAPHPR